MNNQVLNDADLNRVTGGSDFQVGKPGFSGPNRPTGILVGPSREPDTAQLPTKPTTGPIFFPA